MSEEAKIARGRRLRDALQDPESDISWIQSQIKERVEVNRETVLNYRPGVFSSDFYLGAYRNAVGIESIVHDAIAEGGRLYEEKVKETISAANPEKGPQDKTAPNGENGA